jgi:hypothetical protein
MTATLLLVLLAGHLLSHWVAQSDWQATTKTRSWAALTAHVLGVRTKHGRRIRPALSTGTTCSVTVDGSPATMQRKRRCQGG